MVSIPQGTLIGGIVSTGLVFWLNVEAVLLDEDPIPKVMRIDGCPLDNMTVGDYAASQFLSRATFIQSIRLEAE